MISEIILDRDKIDNYKKHPFNMPVVKDFEKLIINSTIRFLVGENGVRKSAFIKVIAVNLVQPKEGGTENFMYETNDTASNLRDYLKIKIDNKTRTKFFLRAESFYNFSTEVERLVKEDDFYSLFKSYGGNLHECSHGEAFLKLVQNRFTENGLYILDEPEAALSAQRQLSLLCLIDCLVKKGSQFIISTHSPILISYRNGKILDLNDNFKEVNYKDTEIYKLYKMYLDNSDNRQYKMFNN